MEGCYRYDAPPLHLLALFLFSTGCASNPTKPIDLLQQILKDEEAQLTGALLSEQTAAPFPKQGPPKLGLYIMPTGFLHHKFEWTDADRETLQAWANGLQREGLISGSSFLHLASVKGTNGRSCGSQPCGTELTSCSS